MLPASPARPEADRSEGLGVLTTATAWPTDPEASSSHGKLESACMGISPSSPDLIAMSLMATKSTRMPTALGSAADPDVGLLQEELGGIIPHSNRDMGGRTGGRRAGTRALARPRQRIARLAARLWSLFSFSEQITLSTTFCKQLQEKMQGKCQSRIQSGLYVDCPGCFSHDFRLANTPDE